MWNSFVSVHCLLSTLFTLARLTREVFDKGSYNCVSQERLSLKPCCMSYIRPLVSVCLPDLRQRCHLTQDTCKGDCTIIDSTALISLMKSKYLNYVAINANFHFSLYKRMAILSKLQSDWLKKKRKEKKNTIYINTVYLYTIMFLYFRTNGSEQTV